MTNDALQHIENFYAHTEGRFGIAWLEGCYVYSKNIGIVKTFAANNAKMNNTDEIYVSMDDIYEPYTSKESIASSFKYGLYIYEDVDAMSDAEYDNRDSATMLLGNDRDAFVMCCNLIARHHIASHNLDIAKNFPWTNVPKDKVFNIRAVTVNGKNIETNLAFTNFDQMYNAHDTIDRIITSPVAEM